MRAPGRSLLQLLPVTMLVLAIAVGAVRIEGQNADPQRGSAFAMFSTVDIGATRRVEVMVPGEPVLTIEVPDSLEELRTRLADAPSDDSARRFGERILEHPWQVEGDTATVGDGTTLDQVRVKVVGLDVEGRTVSRRVLIDVVVAASDS